MTISNFILSSDTKQASDVIGVFGTQLFDVGGKRWGE